MKLTTEHFKKKTITHMFPLERRLFQAGQARSCFPDVSFVFPDYLVSVGDPRDISVRTTKNIYFEQQTYVNFFLMVHKKDSI